MRSGGILPLSMGVSVWVDSPHTISAGSIFLFWVKIVICELISASPSSKTSRIFPFSSMISERSGMVFLVVGNCLRNPM